MNKIKNTLKMLWNDESGQGAVEYILLLVVVVGLVIMFGPRLREMVEGKVGELGGGMDSISLGN